MVVNNWSEVLIEDCADLLSGFAFKSKGFTANVDDIPLVKGENLHQGYIDWESAKRWKKEELRDYEKYVLCTGDIVLAMDRPWIEAGLKYSWIKPHNPKCLLVQRVCRMRGINGLKTDYLRYIIGSQSFTDYIKPIVTGVNVPHISAAQIKAFRFRLPPVEVQNKISGILSAYDDLIENNIRRIKTLEEIAQNLYREWFIKLRFPGYEKVKMVESELGVIPEGWKVQLVSDILKRLKAGTKYTQDNVLPIGNVPVVDQSRDEVLGYHNSKPDHSASAEKPIIIFGDHTCKMQLMVEPFSVGPNVIPFTSIDDIPLQFLYYAINSLVETKEYKRHWNDLVLKKILIPNGEVMEAFSKISISFFQSSDNLNKKNTNLRRTRDLLLPKLISGELDVENLDIDTGGME